MIHQAASERPRTSIAGMRVLEVRRPKRLVMDLCLDETAPLESATGCRHRALRQASASLWRVSIVGCR